VAGKDGGRVQKLVLPESGEQFEGMDERSNSGRTRPKFVMGVGSSSSSSSSSSSTNDNAALIVVQEDCRAAEFGRVRPLLQFGGSTR